MSALRRKFSEFAIVTAILYAAVVLSQAVAAQGPMFPAQRDGLRISQRQSDPQTSQPQSREQPALAAVGNDATAQRAAAIALAANSQEAAKKRSADLAQEKADWQAKLNQLATAGLGEPQPYSFLALDAARDELHSERQSLRALHNSVDAAKNALEQAAADQEERTRELHHAKDQLERNESPEVAAELTTAVGDAEHELALAQENTELRRLELANLQFEEQIQSLRTSYAEKRVELYRTAAAFTPAMLGDVLKELDARIAAAAARNRQLSDDLTKLLKPQRYQALTDLEKAKAADDEERISTLAAAFQANELEQKRAEYEQALMASQPKLLESLQTAWQRRYELANSRIPAGDTAEWLDESEAALKLLRAQETSLNEAIDEARKQVLPIERKLEEANASDHTLRYWLTKSAQTLEQKHRLCEKALGEIEPARRVYEKLIEDLTTGTFGDVTSRWLARVRTNLGSMWSYSLTSVQDREITVGKIIQGVCLLVIGLYLSRVLSRAFSRRLLTNMGVNAGAAAALQTVAFYILVVLFTLFALKLVEVPLTAFTVLGGAVALGVGFGSQNIVNNFISGLILLAERPVKVGDLIQMQDIYGNVEHIGARSTRIRTGDNMDIIVPNSTFLQTNVINWTLSDNHMRTSVKFGVMYGSPLGKVTHLSLKAAANHDRVFDKPAPFVLFANFGDNSLDFELHFWVAVRTLTERRTIESDIRFNIEHLFREGGVIIAYPQRDLHVHSHEPIQVTMVAPTGDGLA